MRQDIQTVLSELREVRRENLQGGRGELLRRYLEQSEEYAESLYEESVLNEHHHPLPPPLPQVSEHGARDSYAEMTMFSTASNTIPAPDSPQLIVRNDILTQQPSINNQPHPQSTTNPFEPSSQLSSTRLGDHTIKVIVKHYVNAGTLEYEISNTTTCIDLKEMIYNKTGLPSHWFFLISQSFKRIHNDTVLVTIGIKENSLLYNLPDSRRDGKYVFGG
jgi:hypothetical protein